MTKKVTPGAPFIGPSSPIRSATFINSLIETNERYQQSQRLGVGVKPPAYQPRDSGKCKIKNITGGNLAAGACVQLGAFLLGESYRFDDDESFWLAGGVPDAPTPTAKYAILRGPLPQDKIGEAFVSGGCRALVNVSATTHTHATPVDGSTVMNSATSGPCEILSPISGTGEQLVWVRLGGEGISRAAIIEFELTEALTTSDADATASVVLFDQGSDPDPGDAGITVVNPETTDTGVYRFAGASGIRGTAYLITNGSDAGKYRIVQMDCEA